MAIEGEIVSERPSSRGRPCNAMGPEARQPNFALPNVRQIAAPFEHPRLDESKDAGSQDAVASLEVWLRWRPDPLCYHLPNDPRRLLPADFGKESNCWSKKVD